MRGSEDKIKIDKGMNGFRKQSPARNTSQVKQVDAIGSRNYDGKLQ
jgi:hypothetical protein